MTTYIPISETFRGSSCTGSNGATNRTLALTQLTAQLSGMVLVVDGTTLHHGASADYTLSSNIITFLNAIYDTSFIDVNYNYTVVSALGSSATYATPLQVAEYLELDKEVPNHKGGSHTLETVIAAAAASTTTVYTAKAQLIAGTYTFSHGTSATATQTTLTETTHYTLDKDTGAFTLTSAGVTEVGGVDGVFGAYKYNTKFDNTKIQALLDREQANLDDTTDGHWADGTVATPTYDQILNEEHTGRGFVDNTYSTKLYPVANVTTLLDGAVTADDTTITVDSTNGFPSSGNFAIGTDKIVYTGKTSTTFTGCTSVSAHDDNSKVTNYVVEVSNTAQGTTPTFTTLQEETDYELDHQTGEITLLKDDYFVDGRFFTQETTTPQRFTPNRLRTSYLHGFSTIPGEITQLLILMVGKSLYSGQVLNAIDRGTDGFSSNGITDVRAEIKRLIIKHTSIKMSNI